MDLWRGQDMQALPAHGETTLSESKNEFGAWLRNWREKERVSLRALATDLGCKPPYLSRVERNEALPSCELVEKVAARTGAKESLLFALAHRVPTWAESLLEGKAGRARYDLLVATKSMGPAKIQAIADHLCGS